MFPPAQSLFGPPLFDRLWLFDLSHRVCLFLFCLSDSLVDRPCLAGTCLRPRIFATVYSMSSLLKHQARCINAPWQPRLASIDVCLAWHFSRIPRPSAPPSPHLPPTHLRVELFVFICLCLSATPGLSGLRPSVWTSAALPTLSQPQHSLRHCL